MHEKYATPVSASQLTAKCHTHQPSTSQKSSAAAGLSQQAVADSLEIAQQTYANYEVARARPAVSMLPTLAQLFGISVDELLGLKNGAGKRGPTPLLQKQIERLNRLPRAQQKVVMQMLDGVLSQASR
jgi:transcriptional regulator with XRE-family HTH domain